MIWVLDASVAIKWFFTDELERDEALAVLEALTNHPDNFFVPDFFYHELTAVLIRKSGFQKAFVRESIATIYQMGIRTANLGEELAKEAISLSCQHKISFYDAIYVALAVTLKGRWLTSDQKAVKKLPSRNALHLTEFSVS
jgi:predicted nucleic acid-binding protein